MIDEKGTSDLEEEEKEHKTSIKQLETKDVGKLGAITNKSKFKDKLARTQLKINRMMNKKADPTAISNGGIGVKIKSESNAQIINKLVENENNHGELTFGSYIILNIENNGEENRKLSTKFRISDRAQAIKLKKGDYDSN
jgi:hypothetical protein